MCNHHQNDPEALAAMPTWRKSIAWSLDPPLSDEIMAIKGDVWPKKPGLVVRREGGANVLDVMRWGVPFSMPGKKPGTTITKHVTNVRNLQSPFWKSMLAKPAQRCLVLFTRFAEPKIGAGREEHWFTVANRPVAAFAGIWRATPEGNVYAFLTCEPNPLIAPLHPKAMPVILAEDDYDTWLTADYDAACALAVPFPSQLMTLS
jgi:putative SOS response-associated peptidase YedK